MIICQCLHLRQHHSGSLNLHPATCRAVNVSPNSGQPTRAAKAASLLRITAACAGRARRRATNVFPHRTVSQISK